jgi:hypothetical protein
MSERYRMIKRVSRFLRYPLAAGLLTAGLLAGAGAGTAASAAGTTASATAAAGSHARSHPAAAGSSPSAQAAAAARNAIRQLLVGHRSLDQRAGAAQTVNGQTQVKSHNWAGYAVTGSSFSHVGASWTEPAANCGLDVTSMAAFWVGIDGYNSKSVEQDGTMVECYLGTQYQYTWWEMYPTNSVQTVGSTVAAGDRVTSSVSRSGNEYTLRVTDSTHPANSFSTKQTCASGCANSNAEWVAEAPSGLLGTYPLTNFGTWNATGATASSGSASGSVSSFPDNGITMENSLAFTLAQPGPLSSSGGAFSVAWKGSL